MKLKVFLVLFAAALRLQILPVAFAHGSKTTIVKHSDVADPDTTGFWQKHTTWKARWVKYWRPKAIYVPVWKKVWGPVIQNEWVPLPKAPPGWEHSDEKSHVKEASWR